MPFPDDGSGGASNAGENNAQGRSRHGFLFDKGMKRSPVLLFTLNIVMVYAQPQDLPNGVRLAPAVQPPAIVTARFAEYHQNAKAEWRQAGDRFAAAVDNGVNDRRVVYFAKDGALVRTDSLLADGGPRLMRQFIERYDQGGSRPIWYVRDSSDRYYMAPGADDTLWFDRGGMLMPRNRSHALVTQEEALVLRDAAAALLMQGSLAELAMVNSASETVTEEANARLRRSHEAHSRLEQSAQGAGVRLPASLAPEQKRKIASLQSMQGRKFDRRYRCLAKREEKRYARQLKYAQARGASAPLKRWADGERPLPNG